MKFHSDTPGLDAALFRGHLERVRLSEEIRMRERNEQEAIPPDAWAFRLRNWHPETCEDLMGHWHRTKLWVRREGLYAGLVSHCNRVYGGEEMELVGAPDQHPIGALCVECFGIDHSDKLTTADEEQYPHRDSAGDSEC